MGALDRHQNSRIEKPDNSEAVGIADGDSLTRLSLEFTVGLMLVTLLAFNNKLKRFFKGLDV